MSARVAHALDLEAQLGALGGEIAGVLRPLLAPLLEKWEWVSGDHEQVHETARRWRAMSEAVSQVACDEQAAAVRVVGEWEGLAQQSFDAAVDEVVKDLKEVAARTGDVADLLDQAAVAVRRAEEIVRDLIRELIEWAAMSLAISAAGAIITAQLNQLAVELRRIQLLLGVYQSWVGSLGFVQKRLVSTVQGIVIKGVTPLDGKWKRPAIDLAQIRVEPEVCFEEGSEGPRW